MGDAKRLVQVEMADVSAELARLGKTDHRVGIGSIDVHLSTVAMDDLAQLANVGLEHSMSRWIRHHCRGKCIAGSGGFASRSARSMLPSRIAAHDDHLQAGHHGACGVGAVGISHRRCDY